MSDISSEVSSKQWIDWFLSQKGNEFLCSVHMDYILDRFNLTGLNQEVPYFTQAYDMITDQFDEESVQELVYNQNLDEDQLKQEVNKSAAHLYGLIHARFILTTSGMKCMQEKLRQNQFGRCPRVWCKGQAVLPVGLSDEAGKQAVKLYCPSCEDVYSPVSSRYHTQDGVFFGTTFPHMFLQQFPQYLPTRTGYSEEFPELRYVPRIFGFKIRDYTTTQSAIPPHMQMQHSVNGSRLPSANDLSAMVTESNT